MMGGSESIDYLAPCRGGGEHARHVRARRLRGRPGGRARRSRARRVPGAPRRAGGGRDAGGRDDRGARGAPRGRPGGDVQGDAGRDAGRHARARARARRRPPRRGEARGRARVGVPAGDGGGDPRGVRRRPRLARADRLRRRDRRRRGAARGPVRRGREPDGLASARRRGRAGLRARASPTSASRARATRARAAAARCASSRRSRSGTSSSSARATPCRSGAVYLDEGGQERPIVMGSYGIGPGRIIAAAVEQGHDERGNRLAARARALRRPRRRDRRGRAPRHRDRRAARRRARDGRLAVLLDDRDRRPGEKFADADLIGCPFRVTVGQEDARGRPGRPARCARRARGAGPGTQTAARLATLCREMARRRFSESPSGRRSPTLMAETGAHVPGPRRQDGPLRRLPEPPRARQPAGAVERRDGAARRGAGGRASSTSASTGSA